MAGLPAAPAAEPRLGHLARFADELRVAGLAVSPASLLERCQCFRHVDIADGWDRGDPGQLRDALETLQRQAHRLLWLNPLLGSEGCEPLCYGIRTALSGVDQMLPAHDLASLARAVRVIRECR